jgi:hypothetical protein
VVDAAAVVGADVEAGTTTAAAGAGRVVLVAAAGESVVAAVAAVVESNEAARGIEPMVLRWRLLGLLLPPSGVIVSGSIDTRLAERLRREIFPH